MADHIASESQFPQFFQPDQLIKCPPVENQLIGLEIKHFEIGRQMLEIRDDIIPTIKLPQIRQ